MLAYLVPISEIQYNFRKVTTTFRDTVESTHTDKSPLFIETSKLYQN